MYRVLHKDEKIEVREYPPQKRTIAVTDGSLLTYYHLQFPYMVFGHNIDLFVAFTDRPLKPDSWFGNKKIYLPFLPNMFDYGRVCLGDVNKNKMNTEQCISHFWRSAFVGEYRYLFDQWRHWDLQEVCCKLTKKNSELTSNRIQYSAFLEALRNRASCLL